MSGCDSPGSLLPSVGNRFAVTVKKRTVGFNDSPSLSSLVTPLRSEESSQKYVVLPPTRADTPTLATEEEDPPLLRKKSSAASSVFRSWSRLPSDWLESPPRTPSTPGDFTLTRRASQWASFKEQEERRQSIYDRHKLLMENDRKQIEEEFLEREDWRRHVQAERIDRPERERRQQRQILWFTLIACVSPVYTFSEASAKLKAKEALNKLFIPLMYIKIARRRARAKREALIKARAPFMTRPTITTLAKHRFFELWPTRCLSNLIAQMEPVTFFTGQFIIQEGDPRGDAMYIIDKGSVEVVIKKQKSGSKARSKENGNVVATLEQGMYFGEFALVSDEPRMASIVAKTDVDLWSLSSKAFTAELESLQKDTPLRHTLMDIGDQRRRQNMSKLYALKPSQIKAHAMFSNWKDEDAQRLLQRLVPYVTHTGDIVCRQGQPGDAMYFIARGEVEIYKEKSGAEREVVAKVGQGGMFGEIACLFLEARCASVVCLQNCDLWQLKKEDLLDMMMSNAVLFLQAKEATNRMRSAWIPKLPVKYIGNCVFFKTRYFDRLKKISQEVHALLAPRVFARNDNVVERHSPCREIYFIVSGEAVSTTTGQKFIEGDAIGGRELFCSDIWLDTIRAITRVECWFVTDERLQRLIDKFPPATLSKPQQKAAIPFSQRRRSSSKPSH